MNRKVASLIAGMVVGIALCVWVFYPYDVMGATVEAAGMRVVCVIITVFSTVLFHELFGRDTYR